MTIDDQEFEAIRLWLCEVWDSDPAKTLVDAGWEDDEIDEVMESLNDKFGLGE